MSQHPTISVVEPGTQMMRHYRLMEPLDRLAVGDCWIELQTGNALSVAQARWSRNVRRGFICAPLRPQSDNMQAAFQSLSCPLQERRNCSKTFRKPMAEAAFCGIASQTSLAGQNRRKPLMFGLIRDHLA
jgi:hypothetical protein